MTNTQFEAEACRRAELRSLLEENIKIYDGYEDKELAGCLVTVLTADLNFADRAECTVIAAEILSKVNVSPDAIREARAMVDRLRAKKAA
jgi:hypothetical protein